ncbi:MAG: class I SAM-dependent methyltransferase [Acidobacteriota bacterium]
MNPSQALATEYSEKAKAYARHWAPVIGPMALPLFQALPLGTAGTVLDVGTGTGSLLPDLRKSAPNAMILGVDYAAGMLQIARQTGGPLLAVMDAQQLGIRSTTIDVAVLVFVLFHMPDPLRCLREVRRVLRSEGAIGMVTWGQDPGLPGVSIWTEELNRAGARPDPRDPSVMRQGQMDTAEKLRRLLDSVDFAAVKGWSTSVRLQWTLENLLALQMGCGMPARRLSSLSSEARARCVSRVKARLAELAGAELTYEAEVLFSTASRPA